MGWIIQWFFQLCLFVLFAIIIGIFINIAFRKWWPPTCSECMKRDREVRMEQATRQVRTLRARRGKESDIED